MQVKERLGVYPTPSAAETAGFFKAFRVRHTRQCGLVVDDRSRVAGVSIPFYAEAVNVSSDSGRSGSGRIAIRQAANAKPMKQIPRAILGPIGPMLDSNWVTTTETRIVTAAARQAGPCRHIATA
jgi:hypothetical protein